MVKKVFEVEISNGSPKGYETATTLEMPATWAEFHDALEKARIKDARDCCNELTRIWYAGITGDMIGEDVNLYELNLLAQRLAALSEDDWMGLNGLLQIEAAQRDGPIPLPRLINLTFNADICLLAPRVSNYRELGALLYESEMLPQEAMTLLDTTEEDSAFRKDLLEVKYAKNDIMTKRMELENGISLSRLALAQYIGLDPSEPFDVDTAIGRDLKEPGYYLADHDIAVDHLPETKMLDKSIKAKKLEYRLKVGEYMPTIGIGASYQYHNLLNSNHSFGAVFAMVTVPISNWWEGSYEARKKLREVEMAENSVEQARELLKLRMQKIWDEVYAAYMKVSLSEESVEIAEENYRYSKESYDAGMLSMSELLDDYVRLVTSENGNTDAKIEYMLKCREYVDATGGVAGSGSY